MPFKNKEDQQAYNREHYKRTKDRYKDSRRESVDRQRAVNKKMIQETKSQPCTDCEVSYPYYVMQFDHLDGMDKSFNISNKRYYSSRRRLMEELGKCEVVCANCHAERTHQRRLGSLAEKD